MTDSLSLHYFFYAKIKGQVSNADLSPSLFNSFPFPAGRTEESMWYPYPGLVQHRMIRACSYGNRCIPSSCRVKALVPVS